MGTCPGCDRDVTPVNKGGIGHGVNEYVCPKCDIILGVTS